MTLGQSSNAAYCESSTTPKVVSLESKLRRRLRVAVARHRVGELRSIDWPINSVFVEVRRKGDFKLECKYRAVRAVDKRVDVKVRKKVNQHRSQAVGQLLNLLHLETPAPKALIAEVIRAEREGDASAREFVDFLGRGKGIPFFLANVQNLRHETEVDERTGWGAGKGEPPGWGWRQYWQVMDLCEAVQYFTDPDRLFFGTFTLPADTPEAIAALNSYTSWLNNSLTEFVREVLPRRHGGVWALVCKWEIQNRGAYHLHIVLAQLPRIPVSLHEEGKLPRVKSLRWGSPDEAKQKTESSPEHLGILDREELIQNLTDFWQSRLAYIGKKAGVDMFAATSEAQQGRQWKDIAHIAVRIEGVKHSTAAYMAKYMAKPDRELPSRPLSAEPSEEGAAHPREGNLQVPHPPRLWSANALAKDLKHDWSPVCFGRRVAFDEAVLLAEYIVESIDGLGFHLSSRVSDSNPANLCLSIAAQGPALREWRDQLLARCETLPRSELVDLAGNSSPLLLVHRELPGHGLELDNSTPSPASSSNGKGSNAPSKGLSRRVLALEKADPLVSVPKTHRRGLSRAEFFREWERTHQPTTDVAHCHRERDAACASSGEGNSTSGLSLSRRILSSAGGSPREKGALHAYAEGDEQLALL